MGPTRYQHIGVEARFALLPDGTCRVIHVQGTADEMDNQFSAACRELGGRAMTRDDVVAAAKSSPTKEPT